MRESARALKGTDAVQYRKLQTSDAGGIHEHTPDPGPIDPASIGTAQVRFAARVFGMGA